MNVRSAILACAVILGSLRDAEGAKCTYSLSPTSASYAAMGGSGSFSVTTGTNCSWTASTTNSWLHTTNTGTGSGTVNYTVDGNGSTGSRSGAITVGGQTFTVSQAGAPLTLAFALNTTNLDWVTGTNYPWYGTNVVTHDGVASATSGNQYVPSSISWLQTTVVGPGTIGFWWKVDSDVTPPPPATPYSYDTLQFLINGVQQNQIMGQIDWNYMVFPVPAGTNTLTWQYVKDAQWNSAYDRGWLDQVSFTPGPPIALQDALNTCGLNWTSGGTVPTYWTGETNVTHDGVSAAQSGTIYLNQETWMQTTVTRATNVSFWWKVSSQTNFDFLEFYTNGTLAARISGEVNWRSNFFNLASAPTTLLWRYVMTNGIYTTLGQEVGWVDQVLFNPTNPVPPVVTLLGDDPLTVECHTAFTDLGATAQGVCAPVVSLTTNGTVNPNVPGAYTLQYVATDSSGSSATNSRTVNVVDTTPPVVTLNGTNSMTVECHSTFTDPGATALDTCAGAVAVSTNGTVNANLPGVYTLRYVATDPSGNSATNTRTVNVVDTAPPVVTLNGANPLPVECHSLFTDPGATALDACAGAVAVTTNGIVNPNAPGVYSLHYVATDPSGNSATNTRTVNVVDTTPPAILFSFTNLTLNASSNCQAALPDLTGTNYIVALDSCSSVTVTQRPPAGALLPVGTNLVVLTASDVSGNTTNRTNAVIVVDLAPPALRCPAELVVSAAPGLCAATNVSLGTPSVSDNCGVASVTNNAPALFPVGTNFVTWIATDIHGNTTNATQRVIVSDTELPLITCPATVTVSADPGQSYASAVALGTPATSDNCGVAGVTNNAPPQFALGTNLVTWTVLDVHGNLNTCVQQVIVNPAPRLPHSITALVNNGNGTFTIYFAGTSNVQYIVEVSSNLFDWVSVSTNTAGAGGLWSFTDQATAGAPVRFYRSVCP